MHLAERLIRDGFLTFNDLNDVPDGSFEFILTLNVLEHVEDDWTSFRRLASKLAKGGRFLVYVLVFQILWTTLDERLKHYRRYRRAGMERLDRSAGLGVCKTRYVDSLGFLLLSALKCLATKTAILAREQLVSTIRCVVPPSRLLDFLFGRLLGKNIYLIASKN